MRWRALVVVLLLGSAARPAAAEEGLFVSRLSYGASSVHPEIPTLGQLWNASADLTLGERTGVIGGAVLVLHGEARSLGLHLGIKTLLVDRFWNRVYLHASPELLRVWGTGQKSYWDLGVRAGLGYEHVLLWGFGVVVEAHGNAPLGLGGGERFTAASVGMGLGLFMEF